MVDAKEAVVGFFLRPNSILPMWLSGRAADS